MNIIAYDKPSKDEHIDRVLDCLDSRINFTSPTYHRREYQGVKS